MLENPEILKKSNEKKSGKPDIVLYLNTSEYLEAMDLLPNGTMEDPEGYSEMLRGIGLTPNEVKIVKLHDSTNKSIELVGVTSEYGKEVELLQIFRSSRKSPKGSYELDDIAFVDKNSGNVFNLRSIILPEIPIFINTKLQYGALGGSAIWIPPLGKGLPPAGIIETGMWSLFKKVEPLVIFHEVAHTRQTHDDTTVERVEAERDAWRFALQCVRELRKQGLDLLPGVTNSQMLSRLELGLLKYDGWHPEELPKRFSSRFGPNTAEGGEVDKLKHLIKFITAVAKTALKDPSLVTETLGKDH